MAEIKALLKDVRKLIDEHNLKEAQECCKSILRKDKQNYLALVLLGKALEDTEQAPLAFQKAITLKPDNVLAWQGLCSYYEKKDEQENKLKLFKVYEEMVKLPMEPEKAAEILVKLSQLGLQLKISDTISILLELLNNTELSGKLKNVAEQEFIGVLNKGLTCKPEEVDHIVKILMNINSNNPNEDLEVLIAQIYLEYGNDLPKFIQKTMELNFFAKNLKLHQYLCKIVCREFINENSFGNINIDQLFETISKAIEDTKEAILLKSMILFKKSLYLEAYTLCLPHVNYQEPDYCEAIFIIKCTLMLKKWALMQKLAVNFLSKTNDQCFINTLKKYLFTSLINQKKWKEAKAIVKDVPLDLLTEKELSMFVECQIELEEDVQDILPKLKNTPFYTPLQALTLLKQRKYEDTVALLDNESKKDPKCLVYLGKAYWELQQPEKCHYNMLKSAKLDPENPTSFLYFGHYYDYINNVQKASKCYERAYNLDTEDIECVKCLSSNYSKLGLLEKNFELLLKAAQNVKTSDHWISFRLGLLYLNRREWENAIVNFRNVIKKESKDVTAFECLADAYYGRGSYTSALRAYAKVITMDSKRSAHCHTRMGYIYCLLTQYNEAIKSFEKVLTQSPNSVLASKGIAETWIKVARKQLEAKLYGSARDSAQQAVQHLTNILAKHKQYQCLWKLLGDTLMFITKLPLQYTYVFTNLWPQDEGSHKKMLEIFPEALACYSFITKRKQESSSYDLAKTYFNFYLASKDTNHCKISFNLTLECLKKKPTAWKNWNLLGKISLFLKKYDIAQHCFIKALNSTRKWSVAKIWCNLGALYLKLKLHKLANYCFWRGQSALPSYTQSWIGQALIAEVIRKNEAMDLFRHASRLGYHRESALGYADWVCRTLKTKNNNSEFKYVIHGLHAIPYALDLIEWFTCYESENACAFTIFGILQERFGLLNSALKSYESALKFATKERSNCILLNIARIKLRLGRYEESIASYKAITEASFDSACGLALALFKNGLYEEAYAAYDTALHWLSNEDDEKAELLVAMAGIMYMFKGADDAKTLLFHSIQVSQNKPTPSSLFAVCSLGLLHSDQSLSKLALSELKKYERDSEYAFDIGFLKSYIFVSEGSIAKAIRVLSEVLHDHPSNSMLWFCLAQYCLQLKDKSTVASVCAQRALCAADSSEFLIPALIIATSSLAEHLAGNNNKSLALAKRGLHMYPHQSVIWTTLLFSLSKANSFSKMKPWSLKAVDHVKKNLELTVPLTQWVNKLGKKVIS